VAAFRCAYYGQRQVLKRETTDGIGEGLIMRSNHRQPHWLRVYSPNLPQEVGDRLKISDLGKFHFKLL
jgi:hypothetical protein